MDGGNAKNRILALFKGTHPLIIGKPLSNQEIHKETSTLRGVYGGLVILAHPRPMITRGYSFIILQRLVILLVTRVLDYFFVVFENKHIEPKTTPITNRLELLTHRSSNITCKNTSELLPVTTKLNLATLITYSK